MDMIHNPILRGFNPDPSVLRVGDDYYIATSTFEWFPGVQIHHSRDLIHWELIAHPLNRVSQLDMRGNPSSGGIWAPCLSYSDGLFYLIYTDVKSNSRLFKDTHNYLVIAREITGDWSDPIYLNSSGFDPSLFHDDDGRKWLVNMQTDTRSGKSLFGGIVLQEYSASEEHLTGPKYTIFQGTSLGSTEGPHLYRHGDYYYLITAEGGTKWNHAVTLARSRAITGPYEVFPGNPLLTSSDDPSLELQKAGHASLVETQNGQWYLAHLCARPVPRTLRKSAELTRDDQRCVLGRETALQKVCWTKDGWLGLEAGGRHPFVEVAGAGLPQSSKEFFPSRDDFDAPKLNINFQTLRVPLGEDLLSLTERPGFLRLKGGESLSSHFKQSLIARRQQSFCFTSTTVVEFDPSSYQQTAGLIYLYDTDNLFYLRVTRDDKLGKCLGILCCDRGQFRYPLKSEICIDGLKRCYLRAAVCCDRLTFSYSEDSVNWKQVGETFDCSILSDEYEERLKFTGAFIGLCCQDLAGTALPADFDFFEYRENKSAESNS